VKVRTLFTLQVPQKEEYYGLKTTKMTPELQEKYKANLDKMRRKLTSFGKQHREFPSLNVSFHTRAKTMEICFGDPENE